MTADHLSTGLIAGIFVFVVFALGGVAAPMALGVGAGAGVLAAYAARIFEAGL